MPQISVIVPVYKVEQFLARCVQSILSQSFADFELILVDDGSPDNCGAICDEYARRDERVHVIHQKNGGLSAARNAGMDWMYANSDSQWIAFADSDDWIHPDFLQRLYSAAKKHDCKISACGFFRTGGDPFPEYPEEEAKCFSAGDYYCSEQIHGGVTAVAWNKLYHRSLMEKLRYPTGKLHEDEFTTYRAVYASGKIAVLEAPLYAYYQNPEGIMLSQWSPRRLHILDAFAQQIQDAQRNGWDELYRKAVKNYIYSLHAQLSAAEPKYHKQLREKYRKVLKQGRFCDVFPMCWDHLWAYEEAYPAKLFWWTVFRGKRLLDRIGGKG